MTEDQISKEVVDAAIEVHRSLGAGLLESVYQQSLCRELQLRGIEFSQEYPLQAEYKGLQFDVAYRIDLLVMGMVVLELKVVEKILPVHEAQLLSYLRLSGKKLGLLLNFNVPLMKNGIKRIVNQL